MELLNVLAQIIVILAIFLWTVIKTVWSIIFLVWELIRDYTPIYTKKAWKISKKLLKKVHFYSRILLNWVLTKALPLARVQLTRLNQTFNNLLDRLPERVKPSASVRAKILSKLSLAGMVVSFAILLFIFFPDLVYAIIPMQTEPIESAVDTSALGGKFTDGNLYSTLALPEKNEYLPDGNWLVIPKIGVMTEINEMPTEDHEEALKKGVWRVPEFADPTQGKSYPTILVAHKYGYLAWSNQFRRQNSFYNLQKLEIGDTFEIIWDHRRFEYEIYAGEEGNEISDYKADVVLYTCKYLNSPARIFRYARRVEY